MEMRCIKMAGQTEVIAKGTILSDRYRIEGALNHTVAGDVYLAVDLVNNGKVVVKELVSQTLIDTYTSLKNYIPLEGIVTVIEVIAGSNRSYAVMEYVDGITIEDYLEKSKGKFKLARIKALMDPVLCALISLSEAGVHHFNISADNFVFTKEGKLKLIGFGYVDGVVSDKKKPYMPIEFYGQQGGQTEASDVYSICTFIYRCITGTVPASAEERSVHDICRKPSESNIEIDPNSESALIMGMNVEADKRLLKITAFYRAFYGTQAPVPKLVKRNTVEPAKPELIRPVSNQVEEGKTEIIQSAEKNDKTEIISPARISQITSEVMPRNNAQAMQEQQKVQTSRGKEKPKKKTKAKKKGNGLLIVVIVVGVIVAIVLGVITYLLATDKIGGENGFKFKFGGLGDSIEEEAEGSTGSMESTEATSVSENNASASIDELMSSGNYEAAIQAIIDEGLTESEVSDLLQEAIDALYSICVNETNALADNGDYDTAFSIIDARIQYFADVADQTGFVKDKHENDLTQQRYQISQLYVSDMFEQAKNCADLGDEDGMLEAINKAQTYASNEESESKKISLYTSLVLATMTNMSASGESALNIMQYIDNYLSLTGNNCRIMEFWHYYDDIYHKQLGTDRMRVTKIRVSSSGYILPESNTRELTYSDINGLTEYEVYFALYEIYARHNRIFADSEVVGHFQKYSWYNASISPENFDENVLSEKKKKNIDTIIKYQKDMGYR